MNELSSKMNSKLFEEKTNEEIKLLKKSVRVAGFTNKSLHVKNAQTDFVENAC